MKFTPVLNTSILISALSVTQIALAATCAEIEEQSTQAHAIIPAYQSGRIVVGKGRAYIFSAPDEKCFNRQLFLVSGDLLNAYVDYKDFTSIIYFHPVTGAETTGWVKTQRLNSTGTGLAPNPNQQQ